jgi:hypothetical protein
MRSRDHSQTVIIDLDPLAKQFQVNGASPSGGRSTGPRPTGPELARARRCGETTGLKISASSVATRQRCRYPYSGGQRQVAALLAHLVADSSH